MSQGGTRTIKFMHQERARLGNQRGSVMILVAGSIVALFTFAIIAIDGSIVQTTKTQLQNAADAGALAAVSGLATSPDLDAAQAEARARAKVIVESNYAVKDSLEQIICKENEDVEFLEDGSRKVRVTTYRTEAHGDPLRTYFLKFIDLAKPNTADVRATAVAEIYDVCGAQCVKPWAIPDRWNDANGNNEYDHGDSFVDANGNEVYDVGESFTDDDGNGVYTPPEFYDPVLTGYTPPGDLGAQITLHSGQPPGVVAGQYWSIDLPPLGQEQAPLTGGDYYREWIAGCAPYTVSPGDLLQTEPGQMVGPTVQGMLDLIARDPNASWDPTTKSVVGSAFGTSPRVALVPFYDPAQPPTSGRVDYVRVSKVGAFFIDSVGPGSQVTGYFLKVAVAGEPCEEPSGNPTFLIGLHLIE